MLELPEALQQHFAEQVPDAMTAGRLAQASQACKLLLQPRLGAIAEARRLAAEEAAKARRNRKRDLILSCFEQAVDHGDNLYRCTTHAHTDATPCHCVLKLRNGDSGLSRFLNHLKQMHPAQYGIMTVLFD